MTKDEALKMAIEALKNNKKTHYYCQDTFYSCPKHEDGCANDFAGTECDCGADETNAEFDKAIQACKEALEQPAQDFFERGKEIAKWADKQNKQPAQEPYKFIHPYYGNLTEMLPTEKEPIAPSWQGLTNEEVFVIIHNNLETWNTFKGISKFIDVIEQALKEKNHG